MDLSPDEAVAFLKELGVQESGVGALIQIGALIDPRGIAAEAGFDLVDEDEVGDVEQSRRIGFHRAGGKAVRTEGAVM